MDLGTAPPDGQPHTLTAALGVTAGTIAYPLRVLALKAAYGAPICAGDLFAPPGTGDQQGSNCGPARGANGTGAIVGASEHVTLSPLLGPLTHGGGTTRSVLSTDSIGLTWALPALAFVLLLTSLGLVADLVVRRREDLSVRLRVAEYE